MISIQLHPSGVWVISAPGQKATVTVQGAIEWLEGEPQRALDGTITYGSTPFVAVVRALAEWYLLDQLTYEGHNAKTLKHWIRSQTQR